MEHRNIIYRVFRKNVFFQEFSILKLLPRQHWPVIVCKKYDQPIGVTVHSHCFESLLQRYVDEGWFYSGLGKKTIFTEHPVLFLHVQNRTSAPISKLLQSDRPKLKTDKPTNHPPDGYEGPCTGANDKIHIINNNTIKSFFKGYFKLLLEVKLSYKPVCPSIGRSVGPSVGLS